MNQESWLAEVDEGRREAGRLGEERGGGEPESTFYFRFDIFVCFSILTFTFFFLSVRVTVFVTSYGLKTNREGVEMLPNFNNKNVTLS